MVYHQFQTPTIFQATIFYLLKPCLILVLFNYLFIYLPQVASKFGTDQNIFSGQNRIQCPVVNIFYTGTYTNISVSTKLCFYL